LTTSGHFDVGCGKRNAFQVDSVEQEVELAPTRFTFACFDDNGSLEDRKGTRKPARISGD
jgi:hypothetical protein